MSDERAETYLRLVAEAQFRRLRWPSASQPDVAGTPALPRRPGVPASHADIAQSVQETRQAGNILVAAGVLDDWRAARIATELEVALKARSRTILQRSARQLSWYLDRLQMAPPGEPDQPPAYTARPLRLTPIAGMLRIRSGRVPFDLHLMTLVSTPDGAAITVAMRMWWPSDGSSADLEITGPGYHHFPYDELGVVGDQGSRHSVRFGGAGGTATWQGIIVLSPPPPPGARWLDLVAEGTQRLIRLSLRPERPEITALAEATMQEYPAEPPGERLLAVAAERVMARAWHPSGPASDGELGEMTRVLADAGAIAADSQTPGRLAALCQRLGAMRHGITAAPTAEIPRQWASVLAQREAEAEVVSGQGAEVFAPLGIVLPDIEGTRFALAGLALSAGESYLHVVGSGLRRLQSIHGWDMGFSWWLRDSAGHWHVAVPEEPGTLTSGEAAFPLRLTPPLAARPDTIEIVVTGRSARLRAIVTVRDDPGREQT